MTEETIRTWAHRVLMFVILPAMSIGTVYLWHLAANSRYGLDPVFVGLTLIGPGLWAGWIDQQIGADPYHRYLRERERRQG